MNDSSAKLARARFKKLGSVTADSSGIEADKDSSEKSEKEEEDALEQRRKSIAAFLNGARHRLIVGGEGAEVEVEEGEPSKDSDGQEENTEDEPKASDDLEECFPRSCYIR